MPLELPNSLGPFAIDAHGRIMPRGAGEMPRLLFRWRGRKVSARMTGGLGDGRLVLSAWLGRVPSSADPSAGERRDSSFAILRDLLHALPEDWRVTLLPDHQVRLDTDVTLSWPTTAVELMAALTSFLLALAPYLDLLDEEAVLELATPTSPSG